MNELFTVYDLAARRYLEPFFGPTVEFGIRGFKEACETEGHQFAKFPEDYALYHVGSFDPELGELKGKKEAHKIASASQFVQHGPPQLEVDRVKAEGRA